MVSLEDLFEKARHVLVVAIGGGGDVASAAVVARALSRIGLKYTLASIAWERFVVDPVPGPIRLSEIANAIEVCEHYALVDSESYAIRRGRVVVFQAVNASRALGESIYVVDMHNGVQGYVKALEEIVENTGADHVVGVDVGGDSLANGCENNLWSPLADWIGVAALAVVGGTLAVHAPGSDGELDTDYVIEQAYRYSARSGTLAVTSMSASDIELLEHVLEFVKSEASRIPLLAARGFKGPANIRKGSRSVVVSPVHTLTFYLSARDVAESVPPVKNLEKTGSLEEARKILNEYGLYTELDLEEDIEKLGLEPELISGDILLELRARGLRRLSAKKQLYCSSSSLPA